MNLFIDTNIYLDYFRDYFSGGPDNLEPLKELEQLLDKKSGKRMVLLIPEQTEQEYFRNKNNVIEETRNKLLAQRKQLQFKPPILLDRSRNQAKKVLKKLKELGKACGDFIDYYDKEVEKEKTDADILIKRIFIKGKIIKEDKQILEKAYQRYLKGNPPRKNDNSYGDAIIWESLLANVIDDDLTIISRDSDFADIWKSDKVLKYFLIKEWKNKSKKKIKFFGSLAEFVRSINKKSKIKEGVVRSEKEKPLSLSATTSSVVFAGSPLAEGTVYRVQPPPFAIPMESARLNSYVNSALIDSTFRGKVGFCPYCGSKLEGSSSFPLSVVGSYGAAFYGDGGENYTCPHCGERFRL